MKWLEIAAEVDREAVESVNELFAGCAYGGGTVIEEPIIGEPGGDGYSLDLERPVVVKAYLPLDEQAPAIKERIADSLWHLGQLRHIRQLPVRELAEEDWANAWKVHYQVHRVGRRVVIKPSWQEYESKSAGDVVIDLDPGMAFGTGLHPTTQLCIRALERYVRPGTRVLDVGTGSGILAIAAARLGAAAITAVDVDEVAVRAAKENVARNDLSALVTVEHRSAGEQDGDGFDLVVANITARAIAGIAPELAKATRQGGYLLLSGIIAEQSALVRQALRELGLRVVARHKAGDWLAYVVRR